MLLLPALVISTMLAWVDLRTLRLPDPLIALLTLTVVVPSLLSPAAWRGLLASAIVLAAGLLCAGLSLGFGDVKLAAVLAFPLGVAGWPAVLTGILVAPLLIVGPTAVVYLVSGRRRDPLPFGPALVAGALTGFLLR